jgi:hypothetical protein
LSLGLIYGLIAGLIGGLIFGLGGLNQITLVETISWKWNQFWRRTIFPGSIGGLIFGLIGGLIAGLIGALSGVGLSVGLSGALIGALIYGLTAGLIGGFTDRVTVGKSSPNQGIKLSLKNSLTVFLITTLIVGLIFGLIGGLSLGVTPGKARALTIWLTVVVGLGCGLDRGGSAVINHYALRLILWLKGTTPFQFVRFLDHCARLIFLKKVGGGYIFIHRMLLDYFADLTPASGKLERRSQLDVRTLTLQIFRDRRKLLQCRFQFFSDFQSEHVRIGKVRAVFE